MSGTIRKDGFWTNIHASGSDECQTIAEEPEIIKLGVVTIDVSSIGTKFESFVQGFRFAPWAHREVPKAH